MRSIWFTIQNGIKSLTIKFRELKHNWMAEEINSLLFIISIRRNNEFLPIDFDDLLSKWNIDDQSMLFGDGDGSVARKQKKFLVKDIVRLVIFVSHLRLSSRFSTVKLVSIRMDFQWCLTSSHLILFHSVFQHKDVVFVSFVIVNIWTPRKKLLFPPITTGLALTLTAETEYWNRQGLNDEFISVNND